MNKMQSHNKNILHPVVSSILSTAGYVIVKGKRRTHRQNDLVFLAKFQKTIKTFIHLQQTDSPSFALFRSFGLFRFFYND